MESWDFLQRLGLPLSDWGLPNIHKLGVSSITGFMLEAPLELGGFGISRYNLDSRLAQLARQHGVVVVENCKVQHIETIGELQYLQTSAGNYEARITAGSYGKIRPAFMDKLPIPNKNYIGVKYHIKADFPNDRIELHNFKDGYCGISKVDEDHYCLCYLTTADNLKSHGNNIQEMERRVLMQNPYLKHIFDHSEFLYEAPLVISNVSFNAKKTYSNNAFLLGDAAGAIAPLCGNGMSLAMRASSLLAPLISSFLIEEKTKPQLMTEYENLWKVHFSSRIKAGYYIQYLFGNNALTHLTLKSLSHTPKLLQKLIGLTHGKRF